MEAIQEQEDQKYVRQRDVIPTEILETRITLIGVGAVGGTTAFFLAKTGFNRIRVYDFDTVAIYNLPNSIYRVIDIARPKVMALKEILKEFDGIDIHTCNREWDRLNLQGVFICSVDSMETRHKIWKTIQRKRADIPLYIDARMGAEVMRIYTIDPLSKEQCDLYEQSLCKPEDVHVAPCTAKATMYCSSIIAGIIVSQIKKALMEQKVGLEIGKKPVAHEIIYDVAGDLFLTR